MGTRALLSSRWLVPVVLFVVVLAAYALPLFGGATFVGRDHLTHTLPSKQHLAEALRDFHLPLWWDAVDLGVPFAANPNHSALYPPAWIVAVLPLPWGIDVLLVLHVLFAGLGSAALARRFGARSDGQIVAGVAFMLSGFVTSTLVQCGPLLTLAWIPWLGVAADRIAATTSGRERMRAGLVLAAALSAQVLAGDPSFVLIGGFVALAIALCRARRPLLAFVDVALAALGAAALAAVVIVPALYLVGETTRGDLDAAHAQIWSMHPLRMLEWAWRGVLGDPNLPREQLAVAIANTSGGTPGLGTGWALSVYVGVPTLVFAALGWRAVEGHRRALLVVVGLFVVLALGRFTPIYAVFRTVFLPEQLVQYPEKYMCGALVITCAMAGRGLTELFAQPVSRRLAIGGAIVVGSLGLVAAVTAFAGEALARMLTDSDAIDVGASTVHARDSALVGFVTALVISAGLVLARREGRARHWGVPLAIGALAVHLIAGVWRLLPVIDRAVITAPPALLAGVAPGPARTRIHRPRNLPGFQQGTLIQNRRHLYDTAIQNSSTRFGFADMPGYDQAHSQRLQRVSAAALLPQMLALYGVELAIVPAPVAQTIDAQPVASDPVTGAVLGRARGVRPRAFVASRWHWVSDEADLYRERFARTRLDLSTVYLRGQGQGGGAHGEAVRCDLESPRDELVRLRCAGEGYAVLLDTWMPGWAATVDGEPAQIELADGLVRAVRVGPGVHTIEHTYVPPGFTLGAGVSGLAWITWIAAFAFVRRRA